MKIGTLHGDDEGTGSVVATAEFLGKSALYRADVLMGCFYDLLEVYNQARAAVGWEEVAIEFVPVDEFAEAEDDSP